MYKFFSETTVHGLNHIKKEKHWLLQLFWLSISLAALTGASVAFYYQIHAFAQQNMSSGYNIKTGKNMKLPNLFLCTNYPLNAAKLRALNVSKQLSQLLLASVTYSPTDPSADVLKVTKNEYDYLKHKLNASDFEDVIRSFSVSCRDIIKGCRTSPILPWKEDCCQEVSRGRNTQKKLNSLQSSGPRVHENDDGKQQCAIYPRETRVAGDLTPFFPFTPFHAVYLGAPNQPYRYRKLVPGKKIGSQTIRPME